MRKLTLRGGPRMSVDNDRCELYGICEWEAPSLFELEKDAARIKYKRVLSAGDYDEAAAAARACPMQAIVLRGLSNE